MRVRVRVTKGNGWYEGAEGEEFEVIRAQTNGKGQKEYIVIEDGGSYNWIDEDDCEIVEG